MSLNWTALRIVAQAAGEMALPVPTTLVGNVTAQTAQLTALLNSAGAELVGYYPWQELSAPFSVATIPTVDSYALPDDYGYFVDQTQWDATNHWPLLGPKSAQEWAWLKNSFVASLPRMRFRVLGNQLKFYPTPQAVYNFYMEYVSRNWLTSVGIPTDMVVADADEILFNPWLMIKFLKLKFYQLKGFSTDGVGVDFKNTFDSITAKDTGAEKLSLAPQVQTPYIGPWSIPDGSWQV